MENLTLIFKIHKILNIIKQSRTVNRKPGTLEDQKSLCVCFVVVIDPSLFPVFSCMILKDSHDNIYQCI